MTLVAEAKLLPALVHGEATCAPGTQEPVLVRGAPLLPALGHRVAVTAPGEQDPRVQIFVEPCLQIVENLSLFQRGRGSLSEQ